MWSYTENHYAPPPPYVAAEPFEPYALAAVELADEGIVVLGQVAKGVRAAELKVGMEMQLELDTLYARRRARVPRVRVGTGRTSVVSSERDVAILGVGMHPWGKWGRDFTEYGMVAARAALADAGLAWRDIQFVAGADTIRNGYPGFIAGATFAQKLGWTGVRVVVELRRVRVRRAGAAPGARADPRRLLRRRPGDRRRHHAQGILRARRRRTQDDPDWLRFHLLGATNPVYFALYARRRMDVYGATSDDFAQVKVKNSKHGFDNPNARVPQGKHRRRRAQRARSSPIRCVCSTSARLPTAPRR